ncbi:cerebellin 20 [Thalassophryne amazonica]|uniref:cerebellin 20 n=1 Tax=Thalassophryne amazonica TaxID=390379 RepID=UPI0014712334|nr:cerebellin 20 [Thalassophryne amazonica]
MRVLVALCLLAAACAKKNSLDDVDLGRKNPNLGNECNLSKASCKCCLMQQRIHNMSAVFNKTLAELEEKLKENKQIFRKLNESRTAFSVALTDEQTCYTSINDSQNLIYKQVFINLGGGYNMTTGIFRVPRRGVYTLALTAFSDEGASGMEFKACVKLQVNGTTVVWPGQRNSHDHKDSATTVIVLHLRAGDNVAVNLGKNCSLCHDYNHYNTFSGFLLYDTE